MQKKLKNLILITFIFVSLIFSNQSYAIKEENNIQETDISRISKYDSRDLNIVTSAKDQGRKNTCWSYALASISETNILKNKLTTLTKDTLDLSEDNIAYTSFNRIKENDPLGLTSEDVYSGSY
ncbi:secreted protein, partial [gut metagenome]